MSKLSLDKEPEQSLGDGQEQLTKYSAEAKVIADKYKKDLESQTSQKLSRIETEITKSNTPQPVTAQSVLGDLVKLVGMAMIGVNPALAIGLTGVGRHVKDTDSVINKWKSDRAGALELQKQLTLMLPKEQDNLLTMMGSELGVESQLLTGRIGLIGQEREAKSKEKLQGQMGNIEFGLEELRTAGKSKLADKEILAQKEMQREKLLADAQNLSTELSSRKALSDSQLNSQQLLQDTLLEYNKEKDLGDRASTEKMRDLEGVLRVQLTKMGTESQEKIADKDIVIKTNTLKAEEQKSIDTATNQLKANVGTVVDEIIGEDDVEDFRESLEDGSVKKTIDTKIKELADSIKDTDVGSKLDATQLENMVWDEIKARGYYSDKFEFKDIKGIINKLSTKERREFRDEIDVFNELQEQLMNNEINPKDKIPRALTLFSESAQEINVFKKYPGKTYEQVLELLAEEIRKAKPKK